VPWIARTLPVVNSTVGLEKSEEKNLMSASLVVSSLPEETNSVNVTSGIESRILSLFDGQDQGSLDEAAVGGSISAMSVAGESTTPTSRMAAMIQEFVRQEPVSSSVRFHDLQQAFGETLIPDEPIDATAYFDYLERNIVRHSTNTGSPRCIGHMTSRLPSFVTQIAALLVAMNQNVVKTETAKALTPYERQSLAMLHRLVFNRSDSFYREHTQNVGSTLGIICSGGTVANLTALWCARNRALDPRSAVHGVEQAGIEAALSAHDFNRVAVLGSALMHYSMEKSAGLLGIGCSNLIRVPVDAEYRVQVDKVDRAIREVKVGGGSVIALVGVAGTTDTGAIDPLEELADLAELHGIHFHVDAAWGGPILFSRQHCNKLRGIERASSVTIDGHKQMYLPVGVGITLFRDPKTAVAIEKTAQYIIRKTSGDIGRRSVEGSRPANALYLHAGFNIIGARGYEYLIDQGVEKTKYLADRIRSLPEFELLADPSINILVYRYVPAWLRAKARRRELSQTENQEISAFNVRLQKLQRQTGRSFVSRTSLRVPGYVDEMLTVLRVVLANPLTTPAHLDDILEEQMRIGDALSLEASQTCEAAD
jgi:putative pyridoxal-dependent aspartate 1-decarboxylase